MAKKAPVKKSRRRLKRSVRRSLSAVLMITAIGVAAIPVPENRASSPGIATIAETVPDKFAYPESFKTKTFCKDNNLKNPYDNGDGTLDMTKDPDNVYQALIVTALSDNKYQLDWQFEFFMTTVERNQRGIICNYNSTYQQNEVTLDPNVIYEYKKISNEDYTKFYTGEDEKKEYTLENGAAPNADEPTDKFLLKYFESAYQTYVNQYDQYKRDHDAWKNNPDHESVTEPQAPKLSKTPQDLDENQKLEYYCDQNTGLSGCTLVEVIDSTAKHAGGEVANTRVYIPQLLPGQDKENRLFDSQNLLYISDASIIGIGDMAFMNKENVNKLVIPKEIKYIGTSAFEHSFIKEVSFVNVAQIGDRAFKNCSQLTKVDFGEAPVTTKLGAESFYGTALTDVVFPQTIEEIGPGAFAYCESIRNLDFSKITARPAKIHEYAFYNTTALENANFVQEGNANATVNIDTIGDGAFAVVSGLTGNMTEFRFPTKIAKAQKSGDSDSGLGDCVLAGRTNLQQVIMPADFGRDEPAEVPDNTFYNCYNLACVQFPDDGSGSCGFATYKSGTQPGSDGKLEAKEGEGLFRMVNNPDFYVQGPKESRGGRGTIAAPRRATWDARTAVSMVVPYLYIENGLNYYEISDGEYLMCVNNEGVLTSCVRKDPGTTSKDVDLEIPAQVGTTDVTGIATDCFSDKELNDNIRSLRIADDSKIAVINASAFNGWKNLSRVYIGNSVTTIGDNAFAGCANLTDVTFSSPKNGHESFTIGTDAFKTGSSELTFHGDIVKGYAPFTWAMDKDNIIKEPEGIRVCYQSLSPTFLTVMYDDNNGLVTLLDYPKMSQVSDLLNETHQDEISAGKYGTYEEMREQQSYQEYTGAAFDSRREEFKTAWLAAQSDPDKEEKIKEIYNNPDIYGPWVTPDFVKDADSWLSAGVNKSKIADFFFEPITAYAADTPKAYYEQYPFKVGTSTTGYPQLTAEELTLLDAVHSIVVPDGVESIDVYGYYANSERNKNNAATYLDKKLNLDVWRMYTSKIKQDPDGEIDTVPGLFSGYYEEDETGEKHPRGNDQLTSVVLNSVKYLPDYAFDSCENLLSVDIGPACSDIGVAPFRGCYEMASVTDNDYYTTDNGIIYSKNEDGSLTIEECLSARGRKTTEVGPAQVNVSTDPNLASVSAIKPGAFEDCDDLTVVNFGRNDTAGLLVIPEDCFKNCDNLQEVILPVTVNDIGPGAFAGVQRLTGLTIYGDEVKISGSAFDSDKPVETTVRAYEDSAVTRYVDEYGKAYKLYYDKDNPLGRQWKVTFYDAKYQLIEEMTDDEGNAIDNPQYVTDGEKAVIPEPPVLDGWTFEDWVGMNGAQINKPIREDTIFYAQGHYAAGAPVDGKYVVEFVDGIDGTQLNGRYSNAADGKYYVEAGTSFMDQGWDAPIYKTHDGYQFKEWSNGWTENTVIDRNMTVISLYSALPTSGGSTTNPSGNSTNQGGNNTSNKSSSSSNTSSSTSSSSTSTSSTTSGSNSTVGRYTVTVEGGSGSGSYDVGSTVVISAADPAAGMKFQKWTTESNGVALASVSMPATTFTMPANNVTVTANYVEDTGSAATPVSNTGGTPVTNTGNGTDRVDITKPGISNKDLATANVNGSTDNFIVKITETDEATRAVADALTNKYGSLDNILYYAMDISLYDSTGTTKISDTSGLTVDITIPIPDALVSYGGNNMAGAVVNGSELESLNESFTSINGVPCIRFTATHFSPYTIYVDTGNLTEGLIDTTPKTGDPIHPKWFLSIGLACLSVILFMKKDKSAKVKTA